MAFGACQKDKLDQGSTEQTLKKADVYAEQDYLVFKSIESVDSMKKVLDSKSEDSRLEWERSMNFTSASNYRSKANDKLTEFTSEAQAKPFIAQLAEKGYFSLKDSCLTYPFKMISLESVLNPQGLVKIGEVLYCFQKDKQICIMDGKKETLESFLNGQIEADDVHIKVVKYATNQYLRGYWFGNVLAEVGRTSGKYRFTVQLIYDAVYMPNSTVHVNHAYYEFYFHQQKKSIAWWNDNQTYYHWYPTLLKFGGTMDDMDTPWYNPTYGPTAAWYVPNTSELANVHYTIWGSDIYPCTYNGGSNGPILQMNVNFYSDQVGSSTDPLNMTITY